MLQKTISIPSFMTPERTEKFMCYLHLISRDGAPYPQGIMEMSGTVSTLLYDDLRGIFSKFELSVLCRQLLCLHESGNLPLMFEHLCAMFGSLGQELPLHIAVVSLNADVRQIFLSSLADKFKQFMVIDRLPAKDEPEDELPAEKDAGLFQTSQTGGNHQPHEVFSESG